MNSKLKKLLLAILVIAIYFGIWREIRGYVTQTVLIPTLQHVQTNCNDQFYFDIRKTTATDFYLFNPEQNDYFRFIYTTPAGFYFLVGILFVILFNGNKFILGLVLFYNLFFWFTSMLAIWFGLCYFEPVFHYSQVGGRYFTPAFTFIILAILVSSKFRDRMSL